MVAARIDPSPGFAAGAARPLPAGETRFNVSAPADVLSSARFRWTRKAQSHVRDQNLHRHLNYRPCVTYRGANQHCAMEWDLWTIVAALVTPSHNVLELGARYGTVSCFLAAATNNSGRVVAVEPDPSAHGDLLFNRHAHQCNYHAVLGSVGNHAMTHIRLPGKLSQGYAHALGIASTDEHGRPTNGRRGLMVPNIRVPDLERSLGWAFDAAVVDCEGCLEQVLLNGTPPLAHQLRLLIIEQDRPNRKGMAVYYRGLFKRLVVEFNFTRVWWSGDTMDPTAGWSRDLAYSAWVREPGRPPLRPANLGGSWKKINFHSWGKPYECFSWKQSHGLTDGELKCIWAHHHN